MTSYIMLKDIPVLEISKKIGNNEEIYKCNILNYDLLPISLRYSDVNYDDVMHGWTELRTMDLEKTNAKQILACLHISQSNRYRIAQAIHCASLTDCYWMKYDNENISWNDVNLFKNDLNKIVAKVALSGTNLYLNANLKTKIHTPELTTAGMTAKAWVREKSGLYLYKIAKIEVAASHILDVLDIPHVPYSLCSDKDLTSVIDMDCLEKTLTLGEKVVKCPIITSKNLSIVTFEEFAIYCERHNINPYNQMFSPKYAIDFYKMQIADYILGNPDRHIGNYGFFMNNETGKLISMHPLFDHDHAFNNSATIQPQSYEENILLLDAASEALMHVDVNLKQLHQMDKPDELSREQWNGVMERTYNLLTIMHIRKNSR